MKMKPNINKILFAKKEEEKYYAIFEGHENPIEIKDEIYNSLTDEIYYRNKKYFNLNNIMYFSYSLKKNISYVKFNNINNIININGNVRFELNMNNFVHGCDDKFYNKNISENIIYLKEEDNNILVKIRGDNNFYILNGPIKNSSNLLEIDNYLIELFWKS